MRMWEIRDYSDYSKKRGYGKRMGHRDPEERERDTGGMPRTHACRSR